ncbi:MAG: N-acetyl-gamma-glutamyl-phosphate reductase [Phycisphaerales bacterium]|jgi:N-acetyl-gamma-glutamyl-phosphate reductase
MNNRSTIRCAVVGATGYAGGELLERLLGLRRVEIVGLFGSDRRSGEPPQIGDVHPRLRSRLDGVVRPADAESILATRPDAVFLATPHETSHDLAPALLAGGTVVLDLSAAFRLPDPADYPRHYGFRHEHPELLARAAYGLAELNAEAIAASDLIAVPGCYPTAVILPLRPLSDAGLLAAGEPVIVDAVSGASGAGRAPNARTVFSEVSLQAYGVMCHRHEPEMNAHGGAEVVFTPQLGAFDRGILATIHVRLRPGTSESTVRETLAAAYDGPFVRLLPPGRWPAVRHVERTNHCDIGLAVHPRHPHVVISSAIDNLVKGASGQAVQCFELRFGLVPATIREVPCRIP